jgi:hypothetical protein
MPHDEEKFKAALDLVAFAGSGPRAGQRWRHRASGKVARVVGRCLVEADLTPAVLYVEPPGSPFWWCRPLAEFVDRFAPVEEA